MKNLKLIFSAVILLFLISASAAAEIDPMGMEVYENGMSREEYYEQSIEQYQDFDYSDPQTTTDEELFGVWNDSESCWTKGPLLDYENFPALQEIEEAAKGANGDYTECKELILEYYRNKFKTFHLNTGGTINATTKNMLTAEMRFENWVVRPAYGPYPLSKLLVTEEPRWITATVYDAVKSSMSTGDKKVALHLYSLKKDGYTAIFDSKEGENIPYLELTVNGNARKFYAIADTYLSAGDNATRNFGSEENILVEESYSSINLLSTVNSYTRRGMLKFDLSSINSNDEVTSAVLHIYGNMEASDDPEAPGIDKDSKIVFVMHDTVGSYWEENEVKWDYLDDGGWACLCYDGTTGYVNKSIKEYFPGQSQYRSSIMSTTHDLTYFAGYYAVTKDETFAYHLLREMMNKIREFNCGFTTTEQPTLNPIRVQGYITIFDKCKDSPNMTPEIFTALLKTFYEHEEAMVGSERFKNVRSQIWNDSLTKVNIGALQTAALLETAIVFEEFKAANAPLGENWGGEHCYNGGWKAVAKQRFEACLGASVLPDGSTTDIPINYIWTNISNYVNSIRNFPAYYNFDINTIFDEGIKDILVSVGEHISRVANPVIGTWAVGDSSGWDASVSTYVKHIYNLWPNDASELMKYIGSQRTIGSAPADFTSYVSENSNMGVLRSNWESNAVAISTQANSNMLHTHSDDMSITMVAYGNCLLSDQSVYTYTDHPITIWQKSREAHNSIVVDNADAKKTGGSVHPENREFNNVYDFMHVDSNGYANQFTQRHILFLRPGYFIVTDHITSNDALSHNYRQNWHFLPTANASINEYGQAVTNFPIDANLTIANVSEYGELESELCNGYYSKTAQGSSLEEYKYVSYNKDAIGNTSFQTILFPTAPGKTVDIQTEVLSSSIAVPDARAMRAIIKEENNKETETNYYILLDESKKTEATYGNYKTDASLSLSEHINEKLSRIIIRKGSYIESTAEGKYYLKLDSAVEDLGISFEPSKVVIESSKEDTNLTGLTLFIDKNDVSVVTYNGEEIPFNREGNYIYLGEVPSFDIPEADDEENSFNDNDSNYTPKEEGPTGSIGGGNSSGGGGGSSSGNKEDKEDEPSTPTVPEKMPSDAFSEELSSHWAENEISYLIDNGYVNGNGETLLLSHNITRAEFVKVIVGVLGLETGTYEGIFEDVQEDDWHSVYLECAYKNGLLSGFDDKALPNEAITREQMAKILSNAYSLKHNNASSSVKSSFTDEKNISVWAKEHIDTCYSLGLINGYEDGSFKPSNNTTRAEAFVTIYRLINNIR